MSQIVCQACMFIRFCTASLCLDSDCMIFQIRMAPIGTQILIFSYQGVALLKDLLWKMCLPEVDFEVSRA